MFLASWREIYWVAINENALGPTDRGAAYGVHTTLGPGLRECVYEAALAYELETVDSASRVGKPFPWSTRQFTSSHDFTRT